MNERSKPGESRAVRADVVIVGGGGAGLAAAVRSAELGAKVVLLEKGSTLGGSTAMSVGAFAASNSLLQRRAGITDSGALQEADLARLAGSNGHRDNAVLRKRLAEGSGAALDWLMSYGVRFHGPMEDGGLSSVPRLCTVLPSSYSYIFHLERAARRQGVEILTEFLLDEVLVESNQVHGVRGRGPSGVAMLIEAPRVVLAAGDFSGSPELKRIYANEALSKGDPVNPLSTGDGILTGVEAGGQVLNGDLEPGPVLRLATPNRGVLRRIPPVRLLTDAIRLGLKLLPERAFGRIVASIATEFVPLSKTLFDHGAILVNRNGERFMDETSGQWDAITEQPNREAFVILGRSTADHFGRAPHFVALGGPMGSAVLKDYRRNRRDVYHASTSLARLAKRIGIPLASLQATVEARNALGPKFAIEAPYVALGPAGARITICNAGLAVDDRLRVLGVDGPVEGLYAAGSNGQGGLLLPGLGHHIAWAFVSGRLVAEDWAT